MLVSRGPSATTWSPGSSRTRSPSTTSETCSERGSPSLTTVARGATSAASSSSFCFARSSCQIPIPVFVTMIPRKSASRQSPKTSVRRPSAEQDRVERRDDVRPDDGRGRPARRRLPRLAARRPSRRRFRFGEARGHRNEANTAPATIPSFRRDGPCRSTARAWRSPSAARPSRPRSRAARRGARAARARSSRRGAPA